ncbi:hypothetical protein RUM43_010568 [Polyplax serrata]|uniref:Uncharacterized protein n=1 Tax=Polyplax serrata TaxID=468196 RepID=A0AAN8P498_POLSC
MVMGWRTDDEGGHRHQTSQNTRQIHKSLWVYDYNWKLKGTAGNGDSYLIVDRIILEPSNLQGFDFHQTIENNETEKRNGTVPSDHSCNSIPTTFTNVNKTIERHEEEEEESNPPVHHKTLKVLYRDETSKNVKRESVICSWESVKENHLMQNIMEGQTKIRSSGEGSGSFFKTLQASNQI